MKNPQQSQSKFKVGDLVRFNGKKGNPHWIGYIGVVYTKYNNKHESDFRYCIFFFKVPEFSFGSAPSNLQENVHEHQIDLLS